MSSQSKQSVIDAMLRQMVLQPFLSAAKVIDVEGNVFAKYERSPNTIVPNWYLAPFYAILRAVPDKLGGVLLMFGAIAILFVLPWLDTSKVRSCNFRPMYKWFMMLFFVNFFVLGYVGMLPAEGLYLLIARIGLVYYFGFFLIITPFIGWIEKPKALPLSISDVYLGGGKEAPVPVSEKEIH